MFRESALTMGSKVGTRSMSWTLDLAAKSLAHDKQWRMFYDMSFMNAGVAWDGHSMDSHYFQALHECLERF